MRDAMAALAETAKEELVFRRRRKENDPGRHFLLVMAAAYRLTLSRQLFAALQRIERA